MLITKQLIIVPAFGFLVLILFSILSCKVGNNTRDKKEIDLATFEVDTLRLIYQNQENPDSIRVIALLELFNRNYIPYQPDTVLKYSEDVIRLGLKMNNLYAIKSGLIKKGLSFQIRGHADSSEFYLSKADSIQKIEYDDRNEIGICTQRGTLFKNKRDLVKAKELFEKSLLISIKTGNTQAILANQNNLATISIFNSDFVKAIDILTESLLLAEKISDSAAMGSISSYIGRCYQQIGELDKSLAFIEKGALILEKIGHMQNLPRAFLNIAGTYIQLEQFETGDEENERSLIRNEYKYDNETKTLSDSLRNEQKQLEIRLENETRLRKSNTEKYVSMGGGLLVLFMTLGIWSRMRFIRRSNKKLSAAKLKAEESEAFKQQFLANMSHEIRTPMNAVMGMTNLLIGKQPREDQFAYLDGIKKSSDNLLHIINDILDLSKIEAGKMDLEKIDFSISDTVSQVKHILQHRAEEKGLTLLTSLKLDVKDVVLGDPVRLSQVLINLAGNAIKFTENGSVSIDITKVDNGICFTIVDTGIAT
ncbi:MAG: hypothetical protein HQ521_21800, partial [Bacteroidetes bacterium]|nr:hypothetical protein [Bacteroidota bacterium]